MRMDIFNKLNDEQKIEVIRQFLGVYGVEEALDDGNLYECMNEFDCAIYADGAIGPADDLNTLGDLLKWAIRPNASADEFTAFKRAVDSAREYMKTREFKWIEVKPENQTFDDMDWVLQTDGVWFDDWGNMAFVDGETSCEMIKVRCWQTTRIGCIIRQNQTKGVRTMMYVATKDSEPFEWMALGTTEEEAKEAILTAWNDAQTRLVEMGWDGHFYESVEDLEEDYEIRVEELTPGQCVMRYRGVRMGCD